MVHSWLPDPPDEHRSSSDPSLDVSFPIVFLDESDGDDPVVPVEQNRAENEGYQLLNENDNWLAVSPDDEDEDKETADEEQNTFLEVTPYVYPSSESPSTSINQENSQEDIRIQRDIAIDPVQIQAAMVNVTLPDSVIPSWVAEVPDSEWCSFLRNRISMIQQSDTDK